MIPVKLKLENFFSHKDSEIDFSKFDSALLIGNTEGDYSKSNGSGKSAVFESILWCLFNKSRAAMMDDIIRWGEVSCSVSMEFSHNEKTYKVIRTRNRVNSNSSVEFCELDSFGEWKDLSGSTAGDTNKKIETTIKLEYKTFINSIYFRQNDISEFSEADPSRKKEILKSIIDISRWDEYEKDARKKARDLSTECKILSAAVEEYDSSAKDLEDAKSLLDEAELYVKESKERKDFINEKLEKLMSQYSKMKKSLDTDKYDRVIEDMGSADARLKDLNSRKKTVEDHLEARGEEMLDIESSVKEKEGLIESSYYVEDCDEKIGALREELVSSNSSLASSENMLTSLKDININQGECYVCHQDIGDDLYDSLKEDHGSKMERYEDEIFKSGKDVKRVEKEITKYENSKLSNKKIDGLRKDIESLRFKVGVISEDIEANKKNLDRIDSKINIESSKLSASKDILDSLKNSDFQSLRDKIPPLKEERKTISAGISEKSEEVGRLSERVSLLSKKIAEMEESKTSLVKKQKEISVFEKLVKMLGKSGIQTILLDSIIEDLELTANKILSSICNEPSTIVLETQRVGADGVSLIETLDLKVRKDGFLQNFRSLSGGEKFRMSLALRVALSDLSSRYGGSHLEFLLLDEVNSPLDRYGVETLFVSVIRSLESQYKILVITHDETLKEKFENTINVTKVNGDSEVEFSSR
jgi:DNA repair exonuclease SbcCD ATPase subunit